MDTTPKFCHACGGQLAPGGMFCGACGQPVPGATPVPEPIAAAMPPAAAQAMPMASAPPVAAQPPAQYGAPQPAYSAAPPTPRVPPMAAPPVRKSGSGAGMLFLGLAIGIVLMAGVGAVLYFMPMRNIANIIKDEPVDYSSSSSSSHGTISKPSAPDTAAAAEDAEDQGQMGEDGPVTIEYDKQDAQQVMAFLVYALFEQQPEMLGELVSPIGCVFVPYATEVEVPGEFNGEEIVAETRKALVDSDATCLGYSVTKNGAPDKATIYWLGLNYDWAGLGLADYAAPTTAFEFFKGDDGWELSFISPVPDDLAPSGDELKPPPLDFMPAGE